MNKKTSLLAIGLTILLISTVMIAYLILVNVNSPEPIRVVCVGDSLTQSTEYPYDLWNLLGTTNYTVRNFGAGSTTISLNSETPYMNTSVFKRALEFQPNIVIIMLGTNDAQPSLYRYNTTFVDDYVKLVSAFHRLSSKPKIWIVLPPPIFSNQLSKIDPEYFTQTIIPAIKQAANRTNSPTIDVYSILAGCPAYFLDGVHINAEGAKLIANEIYKSILSQNKTNFS